VDELARMRAKRAAGHFVAGTRRHRVTITLGDDDSTPGDAKVIVMDLTQISGMVGEVMAEALAVGDTDLIAAVGRLSLAVDDGLSAARRAAERKE
jgi:hypothetical protein